MRLVAISVGALVLVSSSPALACWELAATESGVSPQLLVAIGGAESSLNPKAVNRSHIGRTGTVDIGIMQINSGNLKGLKKQGITEEHLFDKCTNIRVGAAILRERFNKYGVTYEAVGAYNASCTTLNTAQCRHARSKYAWRVYKHLAPPAENSIPHRATVRAAALSPAQVKASPAARPRTGGVRKGVRAPNTISRASARVVYLFQERLL